ncbi:piggyBac transposable element-derived protein 4-like [Hydractinia symbiolongicarpus]|uniref:piggyBac transposable element-derived protein 4-like n=1 Tax=Hydractinia symbiolongicarpus TaxID=13093 RepID=UPI002550D54F|nr:piggyBac transposable element-derived protein 4-like [Hydractinia symbiolongicarpus]
MRLAKKKWKKVDETYQNPNSNAPFFEFNGLKRPASDADTPLECFYLFFTPEILNQVVVETNRYYQQEQLKKPSSMKWSDTNAEEIQAFFAVVLAMGRVKLPELEDYWREDPIYSMNWFPAVCTRTRFKEILRFLHLANNDNELPRNDPNHDKLYKLGNLPAKLSDIFYKMYAPQRELSLDEQMIGTKSRVSFIQYMPKKPKKFGIKIWVLCEAVTGYCLQFQIYTGKTEGTVEHGLSYRIVFDLLQKYLGKGYLVFFDNFYTSLKLVDDFQKQQTYSCGTLRKGRAQLPVAFQTEKIGSRSCVLSPAKQCRRCALEG